MPYIMLLTVCLLVFIGCLVGVRSLRVYRRKRNIAVYAVFIVAFVSIAYLTYGASLGPNYVSFSIAKAQTPIYPGQQNSFSITCHSDGAKDANFYMIILSENASLTTAGQQGYIQVNQTCIKIPFSFHGAGEQTKPVYFTAQANTDSLEFRPRVERGSGDYVVSVYLSEIQCNWDTATHSYAMGDSMPLPEP
jgi:hypothetical protein